MIPQAHRINTRVIIVDSVERIPVQWLAELSSIVSRGGLLTMFQATEIFTCG